MRKLNHIKRYKVLRRFKQFRLLKLLEHFPEHSSTMPYRHPYRTLKHLLEKDGSLAKDRLDRYQNMLHTLFKLGYNKFMYQTICDTYSGTYDLAVVLQKLRSKIKNKS